MMSFCSEGNDWMSAVLAAANRGASSGKRLKSFVTWVWSSTDTMVDRYWSGNCGKKEGSKHQFCISRNVSDCYA